MKRHGKFWRNLKSRIDEMGKMKKKDTVRLKRFLKLLKIEQDKIKHVPSTDFYSRVACGLQKTGGADRDRSPYFSCPRRTLPWALVTATVISVIIAVYSFHAPFSPKLGIDEALFVLTPEVIVLESLSETEDSDLNGILLNSDSKSDAQNSIEWSNRICMLRARTKITSHLKRRSIPHDCVANRLNSLLFALLAPCHASTSTPQNVNLFLGESLLSRSDVKNIPARTVLKNSLITA